MSKKKKPSKPKKVDFLELLSSKKARLPKESQREPATETDGSRILAVVC
jgi:hypothetical protein